MTSVVQFRMNSEYKKALEILLKSMGLDLGTAFRIYASKIIQTGKIPFALECNTDISTIMTGKI